MLDFKNSLILLVINLGADSTASNKRERFDTNVSVMIQLYTELNRKQLIAHCFIFYIEVGLCQ
jgi:hypothetical protein